MKIKRTASILIEQNKMRKNSEVSFFLLTNAIKRNELFGKYQSFDIATQSHLSLADQPENRGIKGAQKVFKNIFLISATLHKTF
jgi:hypothetical protein